MQIPPYLVNEHYDDRYFDVVNAIEEAKHIFFRGTGIMDILSAAVSAREEFRIGETGFGAGRLLIALMDSLDNCGIKDIAITYNSVELHPITFERMTSILSGFRREVGPLIDLLVRAYSRIEISRPGWHQVQFHTALWHPDLESLDRRGPRNGPCAHNSLSHMVSGWSWTKEEP